MVISGQTRSAPVSAANTPERRSGATSVTPIKSASKVKAKMKKMKIKPSFKVFFFCFYEDSITPDKNSKSSSVDSNFYF